MQYANGSHEASSGDIDNDGDLDIYSFGRQEYILQPNGYTSKFFKNQGGKF